MNRAERRRSERERGKREKTYTLTQSQINQMKRDAEEEAVNTAFLLLLGLPLEVLLGDGYWKKSAKRKLPKFEEDLLSLYDSWEKGVITIEDIKQDLWEYGGIKLEVPKGLEKY